MFGIEINSLRPQPRNFSYTSHINVTFFLKISLFHCKFYRNIVNSCTQNVPSSDKSIRLISSNLLSFLFRCGTQWDSNSLLQVCWLSLLTITQPEASHSVYKYTWKCLINYLRILLINQQAKINFEISYIVYKHYTKSKY